MSRSRKSFCSKNDRDVSVISYIAQINILERRVGKREL